jgi:putative addiction module CopG family antidote
MSRLSPDLEQYVQQKIASGQFASPEEFALAAMRLYRDLEDRHESLKRDVQAALEQSERGQSEPFDLDSIKRELTEELDEHGRGK